MGTQTKIAKTIRDGDAHYLLAVKDNQPLLHEDIKTVFAELLIRRHWAIENELHWVLEIAFREDDARHRAKNTSENMTTLRHCALNVIKQDPDRRLGVVKTRKRAVWDRRYLAKLLCNVTC